MPFTVNDLIAENSPIVKSSPNESVQQTLRRMIEHNYSQLPVVNEENKVLGMITYESIVQAISNFNVSLSDLRVVDAMDERVEKFRRDADLFEILDKVEDKAAALIVDRDQKLLGIVTSYDTTHYFRQRAEDIMLVQDIETTLKDFILLGFNNIAAPVDEAALNQTIEEMTDSGKALQKKFHSALNHYLAKTTRQRADESIANEVFANHLHDNRPPSQFSDLTLYDYIELFLHKDRWSKYQPVFHLNREQIGKLLHNVRITRNDLAHFRDDISDEQRRQLHFCAKWLSRHQETLLQVLIPEEVEELVEEVNEPVNIIDPEAVIDASDEEIEPIEDEINPADSRYAPLAIWLQNQPAAKDSVTLSFAQISEIIGDELPESAYRHRAWWANDTVSHVQSREWLSVDWRVASVNMTQERVKFSRIKERERAYIAFYSKLLAELENSPVFKDIGGSPNGMGWLQIARLPYEGSAVASLNFSFARNNQFRVELYIDSGDQTENKRIFDILLNRHKEEIETKMEQPLSWERLNSRRASRVALYIQGSIDADEEELSHLRHEAVKAMTKFEESIQAPLTDAVEATSTYGLRTPEQEYRVPILKSLVDLGGQAPLQAVIDRVGEFMNDILNEYDRAPLSSTNQPRWRNTTQWERANLVKDGLMVKDSPRGIWGISDQGRAWLAEQQDGQD
ncbi:MAG: DUF4268 domain-containing protein [Ardenticatenaceae bacterium]|nr:DUF4268 domain-containing protein [Ardenticatenaceae bacterium]